MPFETFPNTRVMLPLLSLLACLACDTIRGDAADDAGARAAGTTALQAALAEIPDDDPTVRDARAALAEGRPWQATRLLTPVLADARRRTPAAVLLAATAAAEWGGWAQAERLLADEPWVDTLFGGQGRALLARSALARSPRSARTDAAAAEHAERAVRSATNDDERGVRVTLLARAYDRLQDDARAGAEYARAATLLPAAADWLRLRAAGVTADSARRAGLYADVRGAAARSHVPRVEAEARERARDFPGAERAYAAAGRRVDALRMRLLADSARGGSADLAGVRRELLDLVQARAGTTHAREAAALLDARFAPLSAAEQLLVARSAAAGGPTDRAVRGFAAAFGAGLGTDADRFAHASALARLGRDSEAAAAFARLTTGPRAPAAAYQRARSLVRAGRGAEGRAALQRVLAVHAGDTAAASQALYLMGDLATDDARDAEARARFLELVRRYPTSAFAPAAAFRAGIIALVAGDARTAAAELDALAVRWPGADDALAARYWSGRAWAAAGDAGAARDRWRDVATRESASYYGMLASARLGERPWLPADERDAFTRVPEVDAAMARATLLGRLGFGPEATTEHDQLAEQAGVSLERRLAIAAAFRDAGLASRAIRTARPALADSAAQRAPVYRLVYPLAYADVLRAESAARRLDPALVAALVRQESYFTAGATSPAGARGLMQVMPDVGRQIAQGLAYPFWDPVLLYQPDVNAQLGARHLAAALGKYDHLAYALAAYNAGDSRVVRWRRKAGAADPELFVERIPYVETRDYVRIILRGQAMYRGLYEW